MSYYKKVVYIDYYEKDEKKGNAGFVKLLRLQDTRRAVQKGGLVSDEKYVQERTCMQIQVMNLPEKRNSTGVVKILKGGQELVLGTMEFADGRGILQIKNLEGEIENLTDTRIKEWGTQLKIELWPGRYLLCQLESERIHNHSAVDKGKVQQPEKRRVEDDSENMSLNPEMQKTETADIQTEQNMETDQIAEPAEISEVFENSEAEKNTEAEQKGRVRIRDNGFVRREKWEQLWEMLPHIMPFRDEREYLSLELKDMVILPRLYYRLTENSFLLHGYYNYEHLILAKAFRRGAERYYIGVPGNYYEREKQVAVYFGFESFEAKTEPVGEGDFGYYMIGVDI